ncbi:MAG: hypothetical protein QW273_02490 [Candidatus Pacearchaeota archaeon]
MKEIYKRYIRKIDSFEEYIKRKVNLKIIIIIIWIFMYSYLTLKVIIPYILYNQITTWDNIGHYFSSWYQKEYLFPKMIGWNPFFFAGYPQGQFYPPLFFWVCALLSYFFSLEISYKIIVSLFILLAPLSFFYFLKTWFSSLKSTCLTFLMFSLLFKIGEGKWFHGGDFSSTFEVGLVQHFIAMVLFFFYFRSLIEGFKKKKFVLPSILFSIIILTHIVVSFSAAFAFLALFISKTESKEDLFYFIKHALLTLGLTSFWVIPYLAKIEYMNSVKVGFYCPYFFLMILVTLAISIYIGIKKEEDKYPLSIFLILNIFFVTLFSSYFNLPFHFYRLTTIFILIFFVFLFSFFKKNEIIISFFIIFLSIFFLVSAKSIDIRGVKKIETESFIIKPEGRVFIISSPTDDPIPHFFQHDIILKNKVIGLKGLYVESAKNGVYILNLEKEIQPNAVSWGTYIYKERIINLSKDIFSLEKIVESQLRLFGVNYLIGNQLQLSKEMFLKRDFEQTLGLIKFKGISYAQPYNLIKVGNYTLIEVLDHIPKKINISNTKDWDKKTLEWFLSENVTKEILVYEEVPKIKGEGNEKVEILNMSKRGDYIKFKVESNKTVPVLIKISEFPNWRAYDEEGRRIKIYRASPYLMLVYAKGIVEIKYEEILVDKIGKIISLFSLLILMIIIVKELKKFKNF